MSELSLAKKLDQLDSRSHQSEVIADLQKLGYKEGPDYEIIEIGQIKITTGTRAGHIIATAESAI